MLVPCLSDIASHYHMQTLEALWFFSLLKVIHIVLYLLEVFFQDVTGSCCLNHTI